MSVGNEGFSDGRYSTTKVKEGLPFYNYSRVWNGDTLSKIRRVVLSRRLRLHSLNLPQGL